ncbi:MAG TPA: molybdenum cofactor guanylyltransferase [Hansschlegelia sp.]
MTPAPLLPPPIASIAGLVLMGGRATRMGGGDKALLMLGDKPILAYALARFSPQVGPLALSANGDPARLEAFALPVLPDLPDGPEGPLGGVWTALAWAASLPGVTHLATIPGDTPSPPGDLVTRLAQAAGDGAAIAASARGVEPLHALWPVASRGLIERLIADGVRSPKRTLELVGAATVAFDEPDAFLDVDTPNDLARAKKLHGMA